MTHPAAAGYADDPRAPKTDPTWKPPSMTPVRAGSYTPQPRLVDMDPPPTYVPPAPSPAKAAKPLPVARSTPVATASPPPAAPAPSQHQVPQDDADHQEEPSMPQPKRGARKATAKPSAAPRKSNGASPSLQISLVLLAAGKAGCTRQVIGERCTELEPPAISQALWYLKKEKLVDVDVVNDEGREVRRFRLTPAGVEWTNGGGSQAGRPRTSPAAVKRSRREPAQKGSALDRTERDRLGVVPVTAAGQLRGGLRLASDAGATLPALQEVMPAPSYRCDIGSDASYRLQKGGVEISLTPAETLDMLRYVDRVRGVETPTPAAAAA